MKIRNFSPLSTPSPVHLVVALLVHLDLALALPLESGDLLAPAPDDEAHHGVRDEHLLRGGLDAAAHKIG